MIKCAGRLSPQINYYTKLSIHANAFLSFLLATCIWCLSCDAASVTFEAESATIKTAGRPVFGGWNLSSNGSVAECVRIQEAGTYELIVRAYGSSLGGVWPLMAISVNGLAGESVAVNSREFKYYSLRAHIAPGVHSIGAAFLNDEYNLKEDRNLYLDKFEIHPAPGSVDPILARKEEWALEAKTRENNSLQGVNEAIKKNRMGLGTITILTSEGIPAPGVSISIEQNQHDFLFGCNIFMFDRFETEEKNTIYKARFKELFNYATLPFYWNSLEPILGSPDYAYRDKIVAWCKENGIRMKGHPLLWDSKYGIPRWSNNQPLPEFQKKHVKEVMQKYKGKIEFWDVVNEPVHHSGIPIDHPHRWARETSSEAYLIVNDYGVFADGCPPFFNLLRNAKQNGVPFDGVGIQAHSPKSMAFPLDRVQNILDMYAALGKPIHITEFTPQSNGQKVTGSPWRDIWNEAQQADYADKFYRTCFAHPAVTAITWWDLSDQGSWRDGGGILRKDLAPKPVFENLKKLICEEWRTSISGTTDNVGRFRFSGFYGAYSVALKIESYNKEVRFQLVKGEQNEFVYILD